MKEIFELFSDSRELAPFRARLRTLLLGARVKEKTVAEIVLAVDEALTNIIRHAYGGKKGKIKVGVEDFATRIEILIQDYGKKFDPTRFPPPDLPPKKPGGLGIYLIKTLMDKADYNGSARAGNRLHLVKYKG